MKIDPVVLALSVGFSLTGAAALAVPLLTISDARQTLALTSADIREVDISEAGGYADIFITLMPAAADQMVDVPWSNGVPLTIQFCGIALSTPPVRAPMTGHIYIADTSVLRAEALRAVWQVRARCETLAPEVITHGQ